MVEPDDEDDSNFHDQLNCFGEMYNNVPDRPDSSSRSQVSGVSKEDEKMTRAIEQSLQAGGGGDFGAGEAAERRGHAGIAMLIWYKKRLAAALWKCQKSWCNSTVR